MVLSAHQLADLLDTLLKDESIVINNSEMRIVGKTYTLNQLLMSLDEDGIISDLFVNNPDTTAKITSLLAD